MDALKNAFSSYKKSIGGYFLSTIVYLVWMLVAVGLPFGLFALGMLAVGAVSTGDITAALSSNLLLLLFFSIWMLIVALISLFFIASGTGAYINACYSIANGKVPTMLGNIEYGIKNSPRFLILLVALCIISGVFFVPAALSLILLKNNIATLALLALGIACAALIKFLLMFSFPASVLDKMTALGAISRSLRLVTRHLVQCIIFAILLCVLALVCGIIPLIDLLLVPFLYLPLAFTALALFFKSLN